MTDEPAADQPTTSQPAADGPTASAGATDGPARASQAEAGDAPVVLGRARTTWPITFVLSGGIRLEVPRKIVGVFTDALLAEIDRRLREAILGGPPVPPAPVRRRGRPPKWASAHEALPTAGEK